MAWTDTLQILRDQAARKDYYTQKKLQITIEEENKAFHGNIKVKHYLSTNPALQMILKCTKWKTQTQGEVCLRKSRKSINWHHLTKDIITK